MEISIVNTIKCLTLLEFPTNQAITVEAVRSQYRKISHVYHPDVSNARYKDGERFKELNAAQEYLIENIEIVNKQIAANFASSSQRSTNSGQSSNYARQQEDARRREEAKRRAAEAEAAKWRKAAEDAKRRAEAAQREAENAKKSANQSRASESGVGNNPIKWLSNNRIQAFQSMPPKKMTGTRFATVLGANRFSTPFEAWCAITHTYEAPFEENQYTKAGKAIEPKQLAYISSKYRGTIVKPSDIWGEDYFSQTLGDFFSDTKIFGGMWDCLLKQGESTVAVFEMKTTNIKNRRYWDEEIPENYALQAALYAYLLRVDQVFMVVSFLDDADYSNLSAFRCNDANTVIIPFTMSEDYPTFKQDYIDPAVDWWKRYVDTGISPPYDEYSRKDSLIVRELKRAR